MSAQSYREATRRALETSHDAYNAFLEQAKEDYPPLTQFEDAADLLATLHDRAVHVSTKDATLLALLKAHARGGTDGAALALAMTAMLPALEKIYRAHVRRVRDQDDLWGRVVEAFGEAVARYPILRRPRRVAANLKGDTMDMLRRAGKRARRSARADTELAAVAALFVDDLKVDRNTFSLGELVEPGAEVEITDDVEVAATARAMVPLFNASGINGEARFLILGVHLYERPLRELAAVLGIKYHAAHQRLRRAIARLRTHAHAHRHAHERAHFDAEYLAHEPPPPPPAPAATHPPASGRSHGHGDHPLQQRPQERTLW